MRINCNASRLPVNSVIGLTASATNSQSQNAAGEPLAAYISGPRFAAVMALRTVLDTASEPGRAQIVNPLMSLALRGPVESSGQTNTQTDLGCSGVLDTSPEGRAQQILDVLGSDSGLSQGETVEIMSYKNDGREFNSEADVNRAFCRADTDADGRLSRKELASIIKYFVENCTDQNPVPRLPEKWA